MTSPRHPDAALFAVRQQPNTADSVSEVAAIFLEVATTRAVTMEGLILKARLCRRYGSDTGLASSVIDDLLAMKEA